MPEAEPAPRETLPVDPARWTAGDWSFEDEWEEDEDWAKPEPPDTPEEQRRLHRRIGTPAELKAVADAIVREYEITDIDPRGNERVIVGAVGDAGIPWSQGHGLSEHVAVENLGNLIDWVQSHEAVRLAQTEIETAPDGEERVVRRWVSDGADTERPEREKPTVLRLRHAVVLEAGDFGGLDIGLTLRLGARFHAAADFRYARFHADANFREACFHADAVFAGVRFHADADFSGASFHADAGFSGARFHANAGFCRVRFHAHARFWQARFHADAHFDQARFHAAAGFRQARFHGGARFDGANFHADAGFSEARFHAAAFFHGARFHSEAALFGDLRRADVRAAKVVPTIEYDPDLAVRRRIVRSLRRAPGRAWQGVRRLLDGVRWTLLRSIGELSFLARLSVFALILVPPLASGWPAIRAGIVGYNHALDDASARFHEAAEALHEAAGKVGAIEPVENAVRDLEESARDWSVRFEGMTTDKLDLPWSLALAFFAAAFLTLGQLVYQMRAPSTVRKRDEDEFIEWMHERYGDQKTDSEDGLRRACEWLAAAAKVDRRRHANLVEHHKETVWVPPKERLDWFEDVEFTRADVDLPGPDEEAPAEPRGDADDEAAETLTRLPEEAESARPEGYLPAAVRRRIAIEEGARAEYFMASRENRVGAWFCFVFYLIGMAALLGILYVQGMHVARAAGWWRTPGEQPAAEVQGTGVTRQADEAPLQP